ncbi:hypothetical protein LINPERPRIM_LOCUS26444 [Linum perenne]
MGIIFIRRRVLYKVNLRSRLRRLAIILHVSGWMGPIMEEIT